MDGTTDSMDKQAPGDGEGQGSLVCCSPWGHKELDKTERLNWTETLTEVLSQLLPQTLENMINF